MQDFLRELFLGNFIQALVCEQLGLDGEYKKIKLGNNKLGFLKNIRFYSVLQL